MCRGDGSSSPASVGLTVTCMTVAFESSIFRQCKRLHARPSEPYHCRRDAVNRHRFKACITRGGYREPAMLKRSVCRSWSQLRYAATRRAQAVQRLTFRGRKFDPRAEVGILVASMEHIISKSLRDSRRTTDGKERALHRKVALDTLDKLSTLSQERRTRGSPGHPTPA